MKKRCTACHRLKQLDEFYTNPLGRYGYRSQCKQCDRKKAQERYVPKGRFLVTPELEKELIQDYRLTESSTKTARKFGVSPGTVINVLKRNNIDRGDGRKWYWDFRFFEKRNAIVAYWAGFILADGTIHIKKDRGVMLATNLQIRDKNHLERFCYDIGLDSAAIEEGIMQGKYPYCKLVLRHQDLPKQLISWGIVPNKTYNWTIPNVAKRLLPHFLRGWFDGDGNLQVRDRGRIMFRLVGNHEGMDWYIRQLRDNCHNIGGGVYRRGKNKSELAIAGKLQIQRILSYIEAKNKPRLDRKYQQAESIGML